MTRALALVFVYVSAPNQHPTIPAVCMTQSEFCVSVAAAASFCLFLVIVQLFLLAGKMVSNAQNKAAFTRTFRFCQYALRLQQW